MPNPGAPNPPRWSAEDSFLELLIDTLDNLDGPARGQFLQRFFRSIAQVDLDESQSLNLWEQALVRKRELSESLGKRVAFQAALLDVLASANLLRLPVLMEYEELRKLQINAATDPLTGLYNRRFFDDFFDKELNRSVRYTHRLALVVFDLHRFKEVNDRYGHPQGDLLLQMAASTLRKSLRTSDYAFRIGGDEFALLLPQSDPEQAAALSRRLRTAYAAAIEPLMMGIPLALDFGLAVYPDDGELKEVLIRVADERLYLLKNGTPPSSRARGVSATAAAPPVQAESRLESRPEPRSEPRPESRPHEVQPAPKSSAEPPPAAVSAAAPSAAPPIKDSDRRRWERVSLAKTHAYALIGEGVEFTARVIDLGYGGVALETTRPADLAQDFHAVLHVPILPPVRVNLRRVYTGPGLAGATRIGCSFVT